MTRLEKIITTHASIADEEHGIRYIKIVNEESLRSELLELLVYSPEDDALLSVEHLQQLHPELTIDQARSLLKYAKQNTIDHKSCYGDGSKIYPKWKEQQKF